MASNEETNAAGTDTRPPMLVESDYDSWKIRIHRYIRGKPLGKLIWNSIQNGPSPHPMVTDAPTEGQTGVNMPRMKLDSEFTPEETNRENADTQAEIILSQGLPRHIFNILNQTNTAKEIWDNVEMLMQGSGRTLQQRKEDLFDEFERFRAIGNEPIHDYFVRFHKLVNDMKITQLEIPTHQLNTKFVNNLPSYWGKYVTNVKQNMDISTTNYVHIYTHLKAYEPHATKTLKKQEQSSSIIDPLAYMAQATPTTSLPPLSTSQPQPAVLSPNDAMMATMTQIANLLSGFQKQFPPTNNQLRSSSNSRTHATVHDGQIVTETVQRRAPGNVGNTGSRGNQSYGNVTTATGKKVICYNCRGEGHVARQCKEPKRAKDSQYFKDKMLLMEAKEKGVTLDAEAEAFLANVECTAPYDQPLAMATTNIFEVNHEDAYDSDVDEGPNAAAAFMANLSSTSGNNHHVNELDDNTTPYHQLELERRAKVVPTEVKLDLERQVRQEQNLVTQRNERNAELEQEKVMLKIHLKSKDVSIKFLKSENQKVLTNKKKLEDKYIDEIVCLKSANKVATDLLQKFQMLTHTIPMLSKKLKNASQDLHKDILGRSNPRYGKKAPVIYASNAWDTDETLASAEVSMAKMKGKPGHVQTNMALMAFSDSEVYTDKTCSKTCLENYETLKKQYDDLIVKLNQTEFIAATYKRGLATVEEQLITYRKNEVLFSEEVAVLKREVACKDYEINVLKSEFEKVKQEKEGFEFKIENFDKASKDLDKLLESQITEKSKKGLGYSVVPPPHPLIYNRPKKLDLSYSGLDEFKEPEFKGYGSEVSKKESNVVCDMKSDDSKENYDKSLIESVKPKNHENQLKSQLGALIMYRLSANTIKGKGWTVNTTHPKSTVFSAKPMSCFPKAAQSTVRRPFQSKTTLSNKRFTHKVNTTKAQAVNTARPQAVNTARPKTVKTARPNTTVVNAIRVNKANVVKASAC
ncbi:copia protein [Tanacetum coccineum]